MAEPTRENPQFEARDAEVEGTSTTMAGFMESPEVVVDEVTQTASPQSGEPMVVVRLNDDLEEMTYVAGNVAEKYSFKKEHRYNVPIHIAAELEGLGKVWH